MQLASTLTVRRLFVLAGLTAALLLFRCGRHAPTTMTIERGSSGCLGSAVFDSFAIAPDGAVTWSGDHQRDRQLQLSAAERAALDDAMTLPDDDAVGVEFHYWMRVDGGDDVYLGTARGAAVNQILNTATERFESEWLAGLGDFHQVLLHARVGDRRYRVHVDEAGTLTVKRGGTVLHTEQLDPAQQVLLYEYLLGRVALPAEAGDMVGRLLVGRAMLPVSLPESAGARLEFVWGAVRNADYEP